MPRSVEPSDAAIAEAAALLRAGEVVAFPTETVYGLGADTLNPQAIAKVYALKGRPADNPLIAHVFDESIAGSLVRTWDAACHSLAARFWPGPLTLVLERATHVPTASTAGRSTIAVRCPAHPVARRLLQSFGGPVSAPSANRSGRVSPTAASHVALDFSDSPNLLILDGGPCTIGIESTVLDMTVTPPRILRPGNITAGQLREVLGVVRDERITSQQAGPGTSLSHYAPRAPAELIAAENLSAALRERDSATCVVLCFDPGRVPPGMRSIRMPRDAEEYARRLYESLREADRTGCARIVIELPPHIEGVWQAVHDRLLRATTPPLRGDPPDQSVSPV